MDWVKAKTILIIMFLVLNLFFAANIIVENINSNNQINKNTVEEYFENKSIIISKNLMDELEDKVLEEKIEILYTIEKDDKYLGDFKLDEDEEIIFDNNFNYIYLDSNPDFKVSDVHLNDDLVEFFKRFDIDISNYLLIDSNIREDKRTWRFMGIHNDLLLYDDIIHVESENYLITKMFKKNIEIATLNPVSDYAREAGQVTIWQVFLRHYSTPTSIAGVDYGIKMLDTKEIEHENRAVIAWRIIEENGTVRFFRFSNAEEIK